MTSDSVFGNVNQLFEGLVPDPDRPEALGDGDPVMMYAPLIEGAIDSGVWTCSAGQWDETDYAVNEVMVMLAGRLRITNADGSVHDLTAGDIFYLAKGWAGRWEILEDMKKIYFITS